MAKAVHCVLKGRQDQQTSRRVPPPPQKAPTQGPPPAQALVQEIHTIINGIVHSGTSNRSRKQHVRAAQQGTWAKVYSTQQSWLVKSAAQAIIYTSEEAAMVVQPHDDVMVIMLQIPNHNVHRILEDIGSSMDVLFQSAYDQMRLPPTILKPIDTPLYGFCSHNVWPNG